MVFVSCGSDSSNQSEKYEVIATGTIELQGATVYMYGTHALIGDTGNLMYALKSEIMNLDNYIGMTVTVKGDLVNGYPADGGPDLLNVMSIE